MINVEFNERDILKQLANIEEGLQGKIIRKALTPAIKPIRTAMIALAPNDAGALKRSIGTAILSEQRKANLGISPNTVAVLIGPNKRVLDNGKKRAQGRKAIWLEFGTKGSALRPFDVDPKPFMQPALDQGEEGIRTRFFEGLQKQLNFISR